MRRILLLFVLLIVYGSLYPWQFHPKQIPGDPFSILIHSWPRVVNRFVIKDIGVNILLYIPLGAFGFLAIGRSVPFWLRALLPMALGLVLSSCIEMIQLYDATRICSAVDVTLNTVGAGAGVLLAALSELRNWDNRLRSRASGLFHPSSALFLVYVWIGYLIFPFMPDFSRTALSGKLRALAAPGSFAPLPAATFFIEWLTLARLAEAIAGVSSAWAILYCLLFIALSKLLILTRTVNASELAGMTAALLVWWLLLLRGKSWSAGPLAALYLCILVLGGLAPFRFAHQAQPFSWIPFRAFFATNWEEGSIVFLQKTFLYGAAVWLLRQGGARLWFAATAVMAILAAIEFAQLYLPGRVAESTDPLMAFGVALIFQALERR